MAGQGRSLLYTASHLQNPWCERARSEAVGRTDGEEDLLCCVALFIVFHTPTLEDPAHTASPLHLIVSSKLGPGLYLPTLFSNIPRKNMI